jgi:hypothetical protein
MGSLKCSIDRMEDGILDSVRGLEILWLMLKKMKLKIKKTSPRISYLIKFPGPFFIVPGKKN